MPNHTIDYFRAKLEAYASPSKIQQWIAETRDDFILVDVRNDNPHLTTRIPGAMILPEREIKQRHQELPLDKLLVLYGWDSWCSLATSAAVPLLEKGYRVKELSGGIKAWQTLGLPEESARKRDAP
jgi:rhodanese-related sulfurtransferase